MAMKLSDENRQVMMWTGGIVVLLVIAALIFAYAAL